MISRGRATHYPTLTVRITGRYRAADGLAQPHREPSTHLPQIDRLARTVRRGKRNVNYLNDSSTVRALVPTVAQLAHDDRLRRRAERRRARTRSDMSRVWTMALWRIGKHREKFGIAKVSRQVSWLRYLARREKADLRQSRSCSDCSSRRACWMGASRCMMPSGGALRVDAGSICCLSGSRALSPCSRSNTPDLGISDVSCTLPPWSSN